MPSSFGDMSLKQYRFVSMYLGLKSHFDLTDELLFKDGRVIGRSHVKLVSVCSCTGCIEVCCQDVLRGDITIFQVCEISR